MPEQSQMTQGIVAGLNPDELDACETLLKALQPDLGIDAAAIFAAVRSGQTLQSAMGLPENTSDLIYAQAIARFNAGDTLAALPLFQALTLLAPNVRDHWLGLGICARILEQFEVAHLSFETAIQLSPATPAPRFHLAELCCQSGDWATAKVQIKAFDSLGSTPEKSQLAVEMRRLAVLVNTKGT